MAPPPDFVVPMLAKLVAEVPEDDEHWAFETKWDGIRALTLVRGGAVRVWSRNHNDLSARFPELAPLARAIGQDALLDGEVVALDSAGQPSFQLLQQQMSEPATVTYAIFDLLHLGQESLLGRTYLERRERLESLRLQAEHWQTPPFSAGGGEALRDSSRRLGLEGIVAKRLSSPYEPGKRSGAWLKIKNHLRQEFVIGGWLEGLGRRHGRLGALLLGYYDEAGRLVFAGKVGTGFTERTLDEMTALLRSRQADHSPFERGKPPRAALHVRPELVGEVEFAEWTADGQVRHPSFKGLRQDKPAQDVRRELPS